MGAYLRRMLLGGCHGRMLRAAHPCRGVGGTQPVTSRDSRVASLPPVEKETAQVTNCRQLNGIYSERHGKSQQKGGDAGKRSCPSLPEPVHGRQVPSSGNGAQPGPPALGIPRLQQEQHSPTEHFLWVSVRKRLFQVESSTLGDAAYAFKHIIRVTCRGFGSLSASWNTSVVLHVGDEGIMLACIYILKSLSRIF